jgi:hypothetical protein
MKYNKTKCCEAQADGTFDPNMCFDCSYLTRCKERWAEWIKINMSGTKESLF